MKKPAKYKFLVEVEATGFDEPNNQTTMVLSALQFPATIRAKILKIESNWRLHQEPGPEMIDVPVKPNSYMDPNPMRIQE